MSITTAQRSLASGYPSPAPSELAREQPGDLFLQNWNPLMLAGDLAPGQIRGIDFLGSRVIVYRDKDGSAVVQTAYCPHLGADLSGGDMVDGEVRCPYHHWRFASTGQCTVIPSIDTRPPRVARIYNYPTAERWGIIWAFNGTEPLYEIPEFPDVTEDEMVYRTYHHGLRNVEAWIPSSNSVDFQHLTTVHGITDVHASGVTYDGFKVDISQDTEARKVHSVVYGGTWSSLHASYADGSERFFMAGSAQVARGVADSFLVMGIRKSLADSMAPDEMEALFTKQLQYLQKIYVEDDYILVNLRLRRRGEATLVGPDAHLAKFFDFISDLPKAAAMD